MRFLTAILMTFFAVTAMAEIQTREVTYDGGGASMKGFIAWDDAIKGKRPGVLVVHEWWGHNDYARSRAKQLAGLGYAAMAVDMYGDGKTAAHPGDAMAFMQAATKDPEQAAARFIAAEERLKKEPVVNKSKMAAIGYCFGGAVVLNMARRGADLKGVVSFHGALGAWAPVKTGEVKSRVLVLTGGADAMIPPDAIAAFENEMRNANAKFRVIVYPEAMHAFSNPDADKYAAEFRMPIAYNAKADEASWKEMEAFLKDVLGPNHQKSNRHRRKRALAYR